MGEIKIFSVKSKKKKKFVTERCSQRKSKAFTSGPSKKSKMGGIQSKESGKYVGKSKTLYMTTIKKKRRIINGI